jgi:hypothetical protein
MNKGLKRTVEKWCKQFLTKEAAENRMWTAVCPKEKYLCLAQTAAIPAIEPGKSVCNVAAGHASVQRRPKTKKPLKFPSNVRNAKRDLRYSIT